MGYTTTFKGEFMLDRPLSPEHKVYLTKFAETRRMKRNPVICESMPDPLRRAVELPLGPDACYFVGGTDHYGWGKDVSVIDSNREPEGQPGLWCRWEPNESGTTILWNGWEKFSNYIEWITYLIQHFLSPWGYILRGPVKWQGELENDSGIIVLENNCVIIYE